MGLFSRKSKGEIREETLDRIVERFKEAVMLGDIPEPIAVLSLGSLMTDEFGPKSDADIHVVYPEATLKDPVYREKLKENLSDLAEELSDKEELDREIHFWDNPDTLYTTDRRFFGEPNEDHLALDGWDGLASDYLRALIRDTGRVLIGDEDLITKIPVPDKFPKEQARELYIVSVMDIAQGLAGKYGVPNQYKLAKGILRMQAALHMAKTGEGLTDYADIAASAETTFFEELLRRAYVGKIISQQDLFTRIKHTFANREFPSSVLCRSRKMNWEEQAVYLAIETKRESVSDKIPDQERLLAEAEHQRTAFNIVDLVVGERDYDFPALFLLLDNELISYAGVTELERDWKVLFFPRNEKTRRKARHMIARTLNDSVLLAKYPSLDDEVIRSTAKAYSAIKELPMHDDSIIDKWIKDRPDDERFLVNLAKAYRMRGDYEHAQDILGMVQKNHPVSVLVEKELMHGAPDIFASAECGFKIESYDPANIRAKVSRISASDMDFKDKYNYLSDLDPKGKNPLVGYSKAHVLHDRGSWGLTFEEQEQRLILLNGCIEQCVSGLTSVFPQPFLRQNFNRIREAYIDCASMFAENVVDHIELTYGAPSTTDSARTGNLSRSFLKRMSMNREFYTDSIGEEEVLELEANLNYALLFAATSNDDFSTAHIAHTNGDKIWKKLGRPDKQLGMALGYAMLAQTIEQPEDAFRWVKFIKENVSNIVTDENLRDVLLFRTDVLVAQLGQDAGDEGMFQYAIDSIKNNIHYASERLKLEKLLSKYVRNHGPSEMRGRDISLPEPVGGLEVEISPGNLPSDGQIFQPYSKPTLGF